MTQAVHVLPDQSRQRHIWHGDTVPQGFVHSGGAFTVPGGGGLTLPAQPCEAYTLDTTSGELLYAGQASSTVGPLTGGNGTYWIAIARDMATVLAGWTRQPGTRYLWQLSATQPPLSSAMQLLTSVTVTSGNITAVQDVRAPASLRYAGVYTVTDPLYGAIGDDSADDTAAFTAALSAGQGHQIFVPQPRVAYRLTASITIPANTHLAGAGKRSSTVHHAFNGDLFTMLDGAALTSLYLNGDGDTYTGGAIVLSGTNGRQVIEHLRAINFQDPIVSIATAAGSQMSVVDMEMHRWDIATHAPALTGSDLYAVVIATTQQLGAVPRKFTHIETNGSPAFAFGGCNGVFVSNSVIGDCLFDVESRGVHIANTRWLNQALVFLRGHNNTITGCGIAPQLALDTDTDDWGIDSSNSLNVPPIVDNSGNNRNRISHPQTLFTDDVTWSATTGAQPTFGNADVRAFWTQTAYRVHLVYEITFGTTTTYGVSGAWYFNAPHPYLGGTGFPQVQVGSGYARQDSTGDIMVLVPHIVIDTNRIFLNMHGGGQATFNAPWAWAAGDVLRFAIDYDR